KELAERVALHEHPLQKSCRDAMARTTTLLRANGPGAMTLHALPTSRAKPAHSGCATRGFRMLRLHACELSRKSRARWLIRRLCASCHQQKFLTLPQIESDRRWTLRGMSPCRLLIEG